jgi:Uma2 family endonuclease
MARRAPEPPPDSELRPMSVEEYLRFEAAAETKHEYVDGGVYAMTGVTFRHAAIVTNLVVRLGSVARGGPCRVVAVDVKLRTASDRIYYPDVVVVCTPHHADELILRDPCLVVEVTSPSTARTDRGEKLDAYKGIASLRTYLIVDHGRRRVERHWRDDAGVWQRDDVVGEGSIPIPCSETSLSLEEIYEGVETDSVAEQEPPPYDATHEEDEAEDVAEAASD